jgi:hypothetical protein
MHLLYRRYTRSAAAPMAFYVAFAIGFVALAVFALVRADWLIAAIAIVMIGVTAAGARFMRRVGAATAPQEGRDHV